MRILGCVLVGATLLSPGGGLRAQDQLRIGYIDSQAILLEAPGAAEAQAEFERQMQSWQRELETMTAELDTLVARYQQQQAALLANVRQAREAEIQQRDLRLQTRIGEVEQEAEATRQRLMAPILEQITQVLETMRAEGNYSFILDAAAQSPVIVAADPALDLTEEVVRRLQQGTAAQAPAQPPAQGPAQPPAQTPASGVP